MTAEPAEIPIALRVEALEQLLVERGLVDPAVMDTYIKMYETDVGPLNGGKVVAHAWPEVHNVVVCTLCSCYPWPLLGLPPSWYKDPAYRSRMVREPRAVLAEMGLRLEDGVDVRVWDSSSEVRYFVLPARPAETEGLAEEQLVPLVTRDAMVGVAKVAVP
jgi:nitrile hydratase subunit alpha